MAVHSYDLRHLRTGQKCKLGAGGVVVRHPRDVTAVMLHQAAVRFAVPRRVVDPELTLAKRALNVACHAMTFHGVGGRPAFFVKSAPLAFFVHHGNAANAFSLGMEVDGLYAGVGEDHRTVWQRHSPTKLTEDVIEAARACLVWLVEEGRAEGMPITTLLAHRQTSGKRRSDPGELLWKEVGLWVAKKFQLTTPGNTTWDSRRDGRGRPIPIEWGNPHGGPY